MIYLYTEKNCDRCVTKKAELKEAGTAYEERSADRIKNQEDEIDREALIEASMTNMLLPVIVDVPDIGGKGKV